MRFTKSLMLLTSSALLLSGCNDKYAGISWFDALKTWITGVVPEKYLIENLTPEEYAALEQQYSVRTQTGSYLAGRFAQSNFDWETASAFFSDVLKNDPNNIEIQRRAMVLAMGAGRYQEAFDYARLASKDTSTTSLPKLFLALETLKAGNYAQVLTDINRINDDGISEFIKPLLKSWAAAGEKKLNIAELNKNVVHFYHAILIADYLNDKAALKVLSARDYSRLGLSVKSLHQISNIFAKHGLNEQANALLQSIPSKERKELLLPVDTITDPVQGMGRALFDMATVLYQEYPDSARLFAEMSLYLNPSENDSRILLAHMSSQFKRYDEAIALFNQINPGNNPEMKIKIQRQIAELLENNGKSEQAIDILRGIVKATKNIDAQIQIGDIYREQENFSDALSEYNKAFDMLDNNIPAEKWNLLYARGICHERMKNWDKAEKDLKAALALQPDQPFVLNYLAYSWIDRGEQTDEATRMIEKAVRLQPNDGFIVDSLGWAYFKQGKYREASQALEQAIELSPYDPTINDHLGDAYWQVGRRNEARFQWQRALSLEPDAELTAKLQAKIENGLSSEKHSQIQNGNDKAAQNSTTPITE